MKLYMAVYGTLKQGYGNHEYYMSDFTYEGEAVSVSDNFFMEGGGFPFVYDNVEDGSKVKVEIYSYELQEGTYIAELLKNVDGLEGHPNWYKRKLFNFKFTDRPQELPVLAYMYVIEDHPDAAHTIEPGPTVSISNGVMEWSRF